MLRRASANVIRGFCMGTADLIPGVSGGTVALVTGIYRPLVTGLRDAAGGAGRAVRLDFDGARQRFLAVPWGLVVPLLAGIATAIVVLSSTIERLLDDEPVRMAAVFFGLVIGSVVIAARFVERWSATRVALMVGVAAVTAVALGLGGGAQDDPAMWFLFVAGSIAICAMILPGISGSFLLLMLGVYEYVIAAVSHRDVDVLAIFAAGCLVGLAAFSHGLHVALERWHDTVMAALVGLMVGSLRVLWPWPDGTGPAGPDAPTDDVVVPVVLATMATLVVVGVSRVAARFEGTEALEDPQKSLGSTGSIPRSSS